MKPLLIVIIKVYFEGGYSNINYMPWSPVVCTTLTPSVGDPADPLSQEAEPCTAVTYNYSSL